MKNCHNKNGLEKEVIRSKRISSSIITKNEGPKIPNNFCVFGIIENQKVLWRFPFPAENNVG